MNLTLSQFGDRLGRHSGIRELMDDLGEALSSESNALMLGGGNPALVPGAAAAWREAMTRLLDEPDRFDKMMANYDGPTGRPAFAEALARYFNRRHGWAIGPENIFVTNGSQTAFFLLFNMLAGAMPDGSQRRIQLPLAPEYIGYADQGLGANFFASCRPSIEHLDERTFKYHVDFSRLHIGEDIAALAVSRPTNPTGNVLTDEEVRHLAALAQARDIPLVLDNAYGSPFPHIIFREAEPFWEPHIIYSLSLSKLGLPGTRTGILIADAPVISALSGLNAVIGLATGNIGQEMVAPMITDNSLETLCREHVTPFYRDRAKQAQAWAHEFWPKHVPWRLHVCEGALFLWLWCEGLPITSSELYKRLRDRGVIVVSGHYFFYGLDEDWPHKDECLRISYSTQPESVREGLRLIGEELRRAWDER